VGEGEGRGYRAEMTQTMYACMNKQMIKKELHKIFFMLSPVTMVDKCNCNYWEVRGRSIKV
jgi:hypothetical protein